MYKVLIVDDHESVQDSLSGVLCGTGEFSVVGRLHSAAHAELYCQKLQPDLVFMDVCTADRASGIEAAALIRKKHPGIKLIVMSGFDEITYGPRAKEAGAHAFVVKSESLGFFAEIAGRVMGGEIHFPVPQAVPVSVGEAPLTDREMEVLRLMCRHLTNREIAEKLYISESTVKYRKANMLAKTGFSKAVDLAFYMLSNGWINPLY